MKSRINLLFLLLFFLQGVLMAQEKEKKDNFQQEFDEFNKAIHQEFDRFQSENDSIFLKFLEESWKSFELFVDPKPEKPKPQEQPIVPDTAHSSIQVLPMKITEGINPEDSVHISPLTKCKTIPESPKEENWTKKSIDFYGVEVDVFYNPLNFNKAVNTCRDAVSYFFKTASNDESIAYTIEELASVAATIHLNDWGFVMMLHHAAQEIYANRNDQLLFVWYGLLRKGYDARIGIDENVLFLFAPCSPPLYNVIYVQLNDKKYYLLDPGLDAPEPSQLITHEAGYPESEALVNFFLDRLPGVGTSTQNRTIEYLQRSYALRLNENLVDFYHVFPDCDLTVPLNTPLSHEALGSLDSILIPALSGKTEKDKVDFLLGFIQQGIKYQTDQEQFGKENYLFAEETLYYPFADCEDRSILLAQLLKRYTGLKCILLDYPEHISLAVRFNEQISGNYILFNNDKYFVCDPTFIGARAGMIMPGFKDKQPTIIEFK